MVIFEEACGASGAGPIEVAVGDLLQDFTIKDPAALALGPGHPKVKGCVDDDEDVRHPGRLDQGIEVIEQPVLRFKSPTAAVCP